MIGTALAAVFAATVKFAVLPGLATFTGFSLALGLLPSVDGPIPMFNLAVMRMAMLGSPKCVTLRPYGAGTGLEARDRATISLADRNPSKYGGPTARDSSVRQPPEAEEKAIK